MSNKRKSERFPVEIPCVVEWDDRLIEGKINDLSVGGAFITQANIVPPNNSFVVVTLGGEDAKMNLKGTVGSRVAHGFWEIASEDQIGSFGVEFQDPDPAIQSELTKFIQTHFPDSEQEAADQT